MKDIKTYMTRAHLRMPDHDSSLPIVRKENNFGCHVVTATYQ